jgi:hypothetical protein
MEIERRRSRAATRAGNGNGGRHMAGKAGLGRGHARAGALILKQRHGGWVAKVVNGQAKRGAVSKNLHGASWQSKGAKLASGRHCK